jgi:RNA polymerase sigma-70 factor (ECF subfamily)
MDANAERLADLPINTAPFDLPDIFRKDYKRITQVISRIIGDPARAEELAVDVFFKLWRTAKAHGPKAGGWLYRTAIRTSLDELRRRQRREKYENLFGFLRSPSTPEETQLETERQQHVRAVLSSLKRRDAELLLLRSDGLSYQEIADTLELNPASVGTLLSRAEEKFRRRYTKRYGEQD